MPKSTFTLVGHLGADPELRVTTSGTPYTKFRVAESDSWRDQSTGVWVDGPPNWWDVTCWEELAENVAASVKKGSRVVVSGTFEHREYEVRDGERTERRRAITLRARSVSLDLRRGPADQRVRDRAAQPTVDGARVERSTGVLTGPWEGGDLPTQAEAPPTERMDSRSLTDYRDEDAASPDDALRDAPIDGTGDGTGDGAQEEVELARSA
ncbi:single-stranded DNA-binding protein [Streptomyces sp. NP160]|uniref:single-stranded DNA-binding protein n=1 Tax=Streptomyces sp. NP160 TaxID=2586637 RepID=UPI00111A6AA0|nr:single-stranded DNA-binding protein [Streptomyces sp. NP160]TNM67635.1 single-stranded DNA-binding protein [Streptomyces sp. NP160]